VKTTVELDDRLLRRAKAHAAARGITLKQFLSEAVEQRLQLARSNRPPAWKKLLGGLAPLQKETAKVDRAIADEFEQLEDED
jgi:hypothetical protein